MSYREEMDAEGRLLLLAMHAAPSAAEREEIRRLWAMVGSERARAAARLNQVEALVGLGLSRAGMTLPDDWHEAVESNGRRVEALIAALGAVVARLEADGVASAAIEAGGVLLGSGLEPRGYCPGDIDLLIAAHGWDRAQRAFEAEGFVHRDRRGGHTRRIEYARREPDGRELWLEAGCKPFDRRWVPLRVRDCSQAWLARRIGARKGRGLSVLAPSDALAFVAIHTSLHSFVRPPGLRLHLDVDRIVRDNQIDWERFAESVNQSDARRRVFVSMSMAAGLLGTPVPEEVLEHLSPGPTWWSRVQALLAAEGTVARGRAKLGRWSAMRLDHLLSEQGVAGWARSVLIPDSAWMREHFDHGPANAPIWQLHARRIMMLIIGWKPR